MRITCEISGSPEEFREFCGLMSNRPIQDTRAASPSDHVDEPVADAAPAQPPEESADEQQDGPTIHLIDENGTHWDPEIHATASDGSGGGVLTASGAFRVRRGTKKSNDNPPETIRHMIPLYNADGVLVGRYAPELYLETLFGMIEMARSPLDVGVTWLGACLSYGAWVTARKRLPRLRMVQASKSSAGIMA